MIDLIIEQVGLDMKKRNMKMHYLSVSNVNTLQLEKIDYGNISDSDIWRTI